MTNSNLSKYRKGISEKDAGIQYTISTIEIPLLTQQFGSQSISAIETPPLTQQIGSQWPVTSQILHKPEFGHV